MRYQKSSTEIKQCLVFFTGLASSNAFRTLHPFWANSDLSMTPCHRPARMARGAESINANSAVEMNTGIGGHAASLCHFELRNPGSISLPQ
jgi:hypothetical protein